jgi:hypothetical protein
VTFAHDLEAERGADEAGLDEILRKRMIHGRRTIDLAN